MRAVVKVLLKHRDDFQSVQKKSTRCRFCFSSFSPHVLLLPKKMIRKVKMLKIIVVSSIGEELVLFNGLKFRNITQVISVDLHVTFSGLSLALKEWSKRKRKARKKANLLHFFFFGKSNMIPPFWHFCKSLKKKKTLKEKITFPPGVPFKQKKNEAKLLGWDNISPWPTNWQWHMLTIARGFFFFFLATITY